MLFNKIAKFKHFVRHSSTVHEPLSSYDAIIVGGGHNGLVAAAYLAKNGLKTCVLEKRPCLGGAAVTEEIIPGFKFSRASYLLSLLRPQIYRDLELKKHGLEYFLRNPSSYTPLKKSLWSTKARSLTLGPDSNFNHEQISKFSKKDAKVTRVDVTVERVALKEFGNFYEYEKKLQNLVNCIEPLMDISPHTMSQLCDDKISTLTKLKTISKSESARSAVRGIFGLKSCLPFAYEMIFTPATDIMNKWFETEPLKATILTDACIGSTLSPATVGSSYILLHHVMGGIENNKGAWVYPKGGMGAVSEAIAKSAASYGAHLFTNKDVTSIKLNDQGAVLGVQTADQKFIKSSVVLSNVTPKVTFLDLLPEEALETSFRSSVENINYKSPVTKLNLALKTIPNFESDPNVSSNAIMPHHQCTIHLNCESTEDILNAHSEGLEGLLPKRPMIELVIPSSLDPTLCPKGNHVCSLFTQYTLFDLKNGKIWTDETKAEYANQVFSCIEEYAPGFKDSIIGYEILAPPDLERIFGLTGGHIFHGELSLNQLIFNRPVNWNTFAPYTPVEGLLLCGSGAHPGGGVTGAPGRSAALEVIASSRKKR